MSPAYILILKQIKMKSNYTIPKVVKYDDPKKPWFVYFRYDGKLLRFKKGINYIENLKKRESEANLLRDALLQELKEGWNPLLPDLYHQVNNYTLLQALDFALDKKKSVLAKKTISDYNCSLNFIKTAISALQLSYLEINEVNEFT